MFPTGKHSLEEFNLDQVRSGKAAVNGIWSVLITSSADAAVDFAERYLATFDEVARGDWHLAVGVEPATGGRGRWQANVEFQKSIDKLRAKLEARGEDIPKLCIAFFDPHSDAIDDGCVIVPLDQRQIGNANIYRQGFERTHQAIRQSFQACGLDPYDRVPPELMGALLKRLHRELRHVGIIGYARVIGIALANALLGAAVGAPF